MSRSAGNLQPGEQMARVLDMYSTDISQNCLRCDAIVAYYNTYLGQEGTCWLKIIESS